MPIRLHPLPCLLLALAGLGAVEGVLPPPPAFYAAPSASAARLPALPAHARPNIILLIGDGMGINQIATARRAAGGPDLRLWLDRLPVCGLALTHSASHPVTDSAAAGTALAAGVKTRNGVIGCDRTGADQLTILEGLRRAKGYRTGLVVTKNVTDATPAAFVAEVASRKSEEEIALQLIEERVDVVFGGGRSQFLPKAAGGARKDEQDLLARLRGAGVGVVEDPVGLAALDRLPALGLFAPGLLDSATSAQPAQPALADLTRKALELLAAGDAPFFLMVEGSQIDTAGHKNDAERLVRELLHFDLALGAACAFAAARQDTLVLVTADPRDRGPDGLRRPAALGQRQPQQLAGPGLRRRRRGGRLRGRHGQHRDPLPPGRPGRARPLPGAGVRRLRSGRRATGR